MEHVSFGIRSSNKVIIKDMSFTLAAGESLGIIGPSAAGKSHLSIVSRTRVSAGPVFNGQSLNA